MNESIKEKTAKGLFWGGLSNGFQQLLNLIFGIFLARILTTADYGMVAMLSIFSLIANSLQESGFTAALINKKNITHEDYNAVFWFNIGLGSCMYILLFFCAPFIADFYEIPELTPLARYSFLGFLIASLGIAHNAYLLRHLMAKQKAISAAIALFLSGCTGVALAFLGFAYWGIATQSLVYISVLTLCYWHFSPWRPTFLFNFKPLESMFGFSCKLLITNIFNHINNNLLSVILGKYYSKDDVGYYNQANKWGGMGQQFILGMINGVAQPVFAKVADDRERQKHIFRKMLRFASFIAFPAMLGLALVANELITISITDKWLPSVPLLQLLCVGGAFVPIINLYQQLLISKGRSYIFMWNIIALGILLLATALYTYPYGIYTMLIGYVSINIGWLFIWHFFVWKEIRLSLFHALKDIAPYALVATGVMIVTHYLTMPMENIYIRFIAKISIAIILYTGILWIARSVTLKESIGYLIQKKRA